MPQANQVGHRIICDNIVVFVLVTKKIDDRNGCYVCKLKHITDHIINQTQVYDRRSYTKLDIK